MRNREIKRGEVLATAHVPKLEEVGEYEAGAGQGRRLNEAEKRPEVVH